MSEPINRAAQRYGRWLAWYHQTCSCPPEGPPAEWPDLDVGESLSDYIVRNDVPEMRDEIERLAEALAAEQAKSARVAEMAHRFELIPRARLLGALAVRAKS